MTDPLQIDFDKAGGLVTAVAQDWKTGEVLMVAHMDRVAWDRTLATGRVHYHSRSRKKTWMKGEESGHVQIVKEILVDCDQDAVLVRIEQVGDAACHTGYRTCYHRRVSGDALEVIGRPVFDPAKVYKK
ncbi:MAG: phosphoribosyl-AMP cyclohydrolase [Deltaproteobacteria bacterium RBG_13_65_10]|nr:MAG: phosphoribosyl-AMP cyclohydrolase [Deltaproteobacteria bacterium RBG_13_65_10]